VRIWGCAGGARVAMRGLSDMGNTVVKMDSRDMVICERMTRIVEANALFGRLEAAKKKMAVNTRSEVSKDIYQQLWSTPSPPLFQYFLHSSLRLVPFPSRGTAAQFQQGQSMHDTRHRDRAEIQEAQDIDAGRVVQEKGSLDVLYVLVGG
jgi:hypothetical protein